MSSTCPAGGTRCDHRKTHGEQAPQPCCCGVNLEATPELVGDRHHQLRVLVQGKYAGQGRCGDDPHQRLHPACERGRCWGCGVGHAHDSWGDGTRLGARLIDDSLMGKFNSAAAIPKAMAMPHTTS